MDIRHAMLAFALLSALSLTEGARVLLSQCPHATSAKYYCRASTAAVAQFQVCLNLCPSSSTDPCAPCGNPAVTCSQVHQEKTGGAAIPFTATLKNYQYGDICFSAVPPAGQTSQEAAGGGGLPSVSNPDAVSPVPSYSGIAPASPPKAM